MTHRLGLKRNEGLVDPESDTFHNDSFPHYWTVDCVAPADLERTVERAVAPLGGLVVVVLVQLGGAPKLEELFY